MWNLENVTIFWLKKQEPVDRQTYRQTNRQRGGQTDRETYRQSDGEKDRQTNTHTNKQQINK